MTDGLNGHVQMETYVISGDNVGIFMCYIIHCDSNSSGEELHHCCNKGCTTFERIFNFRCVTFEHKSFLRLSAFYLWFTWGI